MAPVQTATRIGNMFAARRAESRKVFIAYLTAGDPTPAHTASLVLALERGGADLIELGVPFSDPIADGPVIQRASYRALEAGATLSALLKTVREIRRHSQIPLLLFSYLNPLMRHGFGSLARAKSRCSDAFGSDRAVAPRRGNRSQSTRIGIARERNGA